MQKNFSQQDQKIANYAEQTFSPTDPVLQEIKQRAEQAGVPSIQVGDMDGLHLEVITRALGARKIVEIGTLAGYSGVCLLRGAGQDGRLYTFEYEPMHAEVARESFRKAGVSEQVQLFVGPAIEQLSKIESQGPFDLVFIDADKVSYPKYMEWAAKNVRKGGCVLGDNTFAWGMIADETFSNPEDQAAATALREFNRRAADRTQWRSTILPTGEGLTMAVRV